MKAFGPKNVRMFAGTKEERFAGYEGMQRFDIFHEREEGKRPSCYYYDGEAWVELGPSVGQAVNFVRNAQEEVTED